MIHELGGTGLRVSALGFGGAPLGNVYGPLSEKEAQRVIHCALDHGLTYFDTAPTYGQGLSEIRLGKGLAGKRSQVILATKAGREQTDGGPVFDFSAGRLRQSLKESLSRLQTDYLDIFQLHDVEFGSMDQILNESLQELGRMKQEGLIRAIGITGRPLPVLIALAEHAQPDLILSYGHYTLLNTELEKTLTPLCLKLNMGLVNAAPLDMNLLTLDGPPDWHPASPAIRAAVRQANAYCMERRISLSSAALQFALSNETVTSTLVGVRTPEEIMENIRLLNHPLDLALQMDLRSLLNPARQTAF